MSADKNERATGDPWQLRSNSGIVLGFVSIGVHRRLSAVAFFVFR
jgi:hypothetical protein